MVRTRSKRRGDVVKSSSPISHEEDIVNTRLALEEAERTRSRLAKKRRIESWVRNHPPFEILPTELLPTIMLFLDSARDVYNLSLCSKSLRRAVTPEIVVRSAVFQGGRAKSIIEILMQRIKNKNIYIPSTLRLLRLINGRICERGEECCSYHLEQEMPAGLSKATLRPFGLMLCNSCVQCMSANLGSWRSWYVDVDQIDTFQWSKVLCNTQRELATGERVGSLVLAKHIKQIENTYFREDKRKEALGELFTRLHKGTAKEDQERGLLFGTAFDSAMSQYDSFEQSKLDLVIAKRTRKEAKRASRKLEQAKVVFEKVERLLDGFKFKQNALACTWNEETGYCEFINGPSQAILRPLLSAPSGATKKKIDTAARKIQDAYRVLHSSIGNYYPLRLCRLTGQNPALPEHKLAILNYCIGKKTWEEILRQPAVDESFVETVRSGEVAGALLSVLSTQDLCEAFGNSVVGINQDDMDEDDDETIKKQMLAEEVWKNLVSWRPRNLDQFRDRYVQCKREHERLLQNISVYRAQTETIAFLAETTPHMRDDQTFSRQDAFDTMYMGIGYNLLTNNNFYGLRRNHRLIFQDPSSFGLNPWL